MLWNNFKVNGNSYLDCFTFDFLGCDSTVGKHGIRYCCINIRTMAVVYILWLGRIIMGTGKIIKFPGWVI